MGQQRRAAVVAGGSLIGAMLLANATPASAVTLWTKGFRPTGDVDGAGQIVREGLLGVGCERGNRLTIELTLTQGDAVGSATREFQCDGEPRDAVMVIHATTGLFEEGRAQVEATATERDKDGNVIDTVHKTPTITLQD
ncbi:hypothetical protein [Nocardioides immobilis]|nr:hypothetical protein [Nocardioides immobilis]